MGSTTINDGSAQNVAYIQYGDVRLHYGRVTYSGQVVNDPAGRKSERTTIDVRVEGYATRDMYTATTDGLPSTLSQAWLSQELTRTGQLFVMRGDQGEIFQIRPSSMRVSLPLADESGHADYQFIRTCVDNGPHPRSVQVTLIGADSFHVTFSLSAEVYGESVTDDRYSFRFGRQHVLLARQLLSYYGTVGYLIDGSNHLQTRNISLTARFAREVSAADADDFRGIMAANSRESGRRSLLLGAIPQIGLAPPPGFTRESIQVTVGPDQFTLQVQVRDVEQYAIVPPPCSAGEATHEVSFGWWGAIYTATLSGWLEAPPDVPKSRILAVMFALVRGRMQRRFATGVAAVDAALAGGAGCLFSVNIRDELFRNRIAFSFTYMGVSWLAQFSDTQLTPSREGASTAPPEPPEIRRDLRFGFFTPDGLQKTFGLGLPAAGSTGQHHHPGLAANGQDIGQYAPHGNALRQMGGSIYNLWSGQQEGGSVLGHEIIYPPRMGPPASSRQQQTSSSPTANVNDYRKASGTLADSIAANANANVTDQQRRNAEYFYTSNRRYVIVQGTQQVPLAGRNSKDTRRGKRVTAPTVVVAEKGTSFVIQPVGDPPMMVHPDASLEWTDDLVLRQYRYHVTVSASFLTLDGKIWRRIEWDIAIMLTQEASATLLASGLKNRSEESAWGKKSQLENIHGVTPSGGVQSGGTTAKPKPSNP